MQTLALLAFIPAAISAQVILEDDFNDSAVNPSLWSVILPNAGSSVVESGGVLTTNGRGVLGSLAGRSKGVRPRNVKSLELNEIHTSAYCLTGRAR